MADDFTSDERVVLGGFFSNTDRNVFALRNLPEVVKGALFARYSRTSKSLRRLFLDEFAGDLAAFEGASESAVGVERAEELYRRVFSEFGDDSVAQLGGAHVACEHVSNLATKQLEWGRLAAYLEQSTRYIAYTDRVDGRYRYHVPEELAGGPSAAAYVAGVDAVFDAYTAAYERVLPWVRERWPRDADTPEVAWRNATKAKALDLVRGMLPAATTSHVGVFATGQAYEAMLLRLAGHDLAECRSLGGELLTELRTVIPSFLTRLDRPDRGGAWAEYLATTRRATRVLAAELVGEVSAKPAGEVTLVDWWPRDPDDAEIELTTAILYSASTLPEVQLRAEVAALPVERRRDVIAAYVGDRVNRRHKPGRGFERVWYRFDVLADYGGFRDLQRHRMLTIEWQDLTTAHGYETPPELAEAGVDGLWHEALERSAAVHAGIADEAGAAVAQYAVALAYRVRYVIQVNAREAMHLIELRSSPQGHPGYRRIAQEFHRQIAEVAGHRQIADAMTHVDHGGAELERLESERRAAARRTT